MRKSQIRKSQITGMIGVTALTAAGIVGTGLPAQAHSTTTSCNGYISNSTVWGICTFPLAPAAICPTRR